MHKVYLRADSSSVLGYGHLHRLLSLAQMLYKDFDCTFISHDAPLFLTQELEKLSIPFLKVNHVAYKMPDERNVDEEIAFDMGHLLAGDETVVLDGYWFGKKYQQSIKDKGCVLVYIDDLAEQGAIADYIINHSPGVNNKQYKSISAGTCLFTGSKYSLVNIPQNFRKPLLQENIFSRLIIAMGGSDPLNYTTRIFNDYRSFVQKFTEVIVIIGNTYQYLPELETTVAGFPSVEIVKGLTKENVFTSMHDATAAILSASTMAIEYAYIGGALFITKTADNQELLYKGLLESKLAIPVSEAIEFDKDEVEKLRQNQRNAFDGKSKERFIKLFNELQIQSSLLLEKATEEHFDVTYEWASDPDIRAYSFNRNAISLSEHRAWYFKKIKEPFCIYLIARLENKCIGSIRFDIIDSTALISYLVSPLYQGKGIGRIMLSKGLMYLANKNPSVSSAEGYVLPENIPSIQVFERLGFDAFRQNDRILFTKTLYR